LKTISILASLVALCLGFTGPALAMEVTLDSQAAKAVLSAVRNPALSRSEALAVAALP